MSDVEKLLDALPLCAERPAMASTAPAGVRYVTEPRRDFVIPPVRLNGAELANSQVVVISAPAAVGKSMLAEHIAFRTGGVLWDLAQARVGNNYAMGTLATSHGPGQLGSVLEQLQSGRFLLVADALDEARLRVNFDAFTVFLDDLARQLLKGVAGGHPAMVLLGRGESAEFAASWLKELDVDVADVEIEFFDRRGAMEFVGKQIVAQGGDPGNAVLVDARDAIFGRTLELLGVATDADEWPREPARRFLGYAPVLVATARYLLSGGNPQRIARDLQVGAKGGAIWTFLLKLLLDILEREQDKFLDGFRERAAFQAAAAGFDDWDSLFTPDEQCDWLLAEALGVPRPDLAVPPALEAEYRSQVLEWMPEHPFAGASKTEFASPVFEDFVYAQALERRRTAMQEAIRARTSDASYRPTEILARLYFRLTQEPVLVSDDLAVVYESLLAADEAGQRVTLDVVAVDQPGHHIATIRIGDEAAIHTEVICADLPLRFLTRLTHARLFCSSVIELGLAGRLLELGPDVVVSAPKVDVLAASLFVHKGAGDEVGCWIFTGALTARDPAIRFVYGGQDFMVLSAEPVRYPFADKAGKALRVERIGATARERVIAQALFRLAGMFKSEGYAGLGNYAEGIDRVAARNESFGAVLAASLSRGVVTREGSIYKLHPEVIGLDFNAVRMQSLSDEAEAFVREIAQDKREFIVPVRPEANEQRR